VTNKNKIFYLLQKWDQFMKQDKQKQRSIMGNVIYPFVSSINEQYAPKITGMLIDLEMNELKAFLLNDKLLVQKINEAAKMLSQPIISSTAGKEVND